MANKSIRGCCAASDSERTMLVCAEFDSRVQRVGRNKGLTAFVSFAIVVYV